MSIVDHVNWSQLDKVVEKQQRNREAYSPVISLFRWWARRPHAVAGALLDAAKKQFASDSFVVADPFSGGGTVAFEAVRRGLPTYAQDLYRWPSYGLAVCLRPTQQEEFGRAADELLKTLQTNRKKYWYKKYNRSFEISHIIRVRTVSCAECKKRTYLFREPFISLASRSFKEREGFFGCTRCGTVSRRRMTAKSFSCDSCGIRAKTFNEVDFTSDERFICGHCKGGTEHQRILKTALSWHPVLVQERDLTDKHPQLILRTVRKSDPIDDNRSTSSPGFLPMPIPMGLETNHLLQSGFCVWGDLYSERQLGTIAGAVAIIRDMDISPAVRDRLTLAVLGAAEMPAYLCRWERFHPKTIEAIANHRFARATVVVETNLMSPVGRGTIPRRLDAVKKALEWLSTKKPLAVSFKTSRARIKCSPKDVLVVTGSSDRQLLADNSASLVLTDPPYHDDLQYGELSRLFHSWMKQTIGGHLPNEDAEAVPNSSRGNGDDHYTNKVAACLKESRRTLGKDGRLILTFHNRNIAAWNSLAAALRKARFLVVGLATVSAENSVDHSKRHKDTFLRDLVIECVHAPRIRTGRTKVTVKGSTRGAERKELLAIGRALARAVNAKKSIDVETLYTKYRNECSSKSVLIQ